MTNYLTSKNQYKGENMKEYYENKDFIVKIDNENKVYNIIKNKYLEKKDYRTALFTLVKAIKSMGTHEWHVIQYMIMKKASNIVNSFKDEILKNELSLEDIYKYLKNNIHFFINNNSLKDFDDKQNRSRRLYCLYGISKELYLVDYYMDSGGNSNVFMVKRLIDNKAFVLKYIKRDINNSFLKEVNAIKSLNHTNIIKILDHSDLSDKDVKFYLTKNYKYSLHEYLFLRSVNYEMNDFTLESKINFMLSIVNGLECIQKNGLAHFDIKADNIFFDDINEPVIADFGCVINLKEDKIVKKIDTKLGNHPNASPEQRNFPYTRYHNLEFSDIYSAGIVFNQLVSGKSFEGTLDKKMYSKIEGHLSYLVWITTNMTANNPENRPTFSLVSETLELFKKIWNHKIKSVSDISLSKTINMNLRHEVPVIKTVPNTSSDFFTDALDSIKDPAHEEFIKKFKEAEKTNLVTSTGLFYDLVDEHIRLEYKKLNLDANTIIGQIFAVPYSNCYEIKNSFCIKSFVVDKNENNDVLFSQFNDTVVMYLNTPLSNFFHLLNTEDLLKYYRESLVEHYFYHHEDDFLNVYHSNKLFFKIIKFYDDTELLCFGENDNKDLIFFVSANKVFKLPPIYLNILKT